MSTSANPVGALLRSNPHLSLAAPALEPALQAAFRSLLTTGNGQQAAVEGLTSFLKTPEGAALATKGTTRLLGGLDDALRAGVETAPHYVKLLEKAGSPATQKAVLELCKKLGTDGDVVAKALNGVLKAVSKGGLQGGFTSLLKLSPKALAVLGKAANVLPVAGLIISGALAAKTLLDPKASEAQKAAAVVSIASGIIGTALPGAGLVTAVVDIGAGLAADGFDAATKKA